MAVCRYEVAEQNKTGKNDARAPTTTQPPSTPPTALQTFRRRLGNETAVGNSKAKQTSSQRSIEGVYVELAQVAHRGMEGSMLRKCKSKQNGRESGES